MAYKRIDLVLRKKIFVLLRSAELDSFMQINRFSDEDQGWIKEAKNKFTKASIIFYFLNHNYNGYCLDSFLPIYNNQEELNEAPGKIDIGKALCLRPSIEELMVKSWRRENVENLIIPVSRKANWQGEYGFGLQEDGNMAAEMDIDPRAGVPVTQGYIDFLKTQLNAYQIKASMRPEFVSYVNEITEEIAEIQRELNSTQTISQHQKLQETKTGLESINMTQLIELQERICRTQLIELERITMAHRRRLETISWQFRIQKMFAYSEMDPAFLDMKDVAAWPSIIQTEDPSGYIKVPRKFFKKKRENPKGYCYVVCVKGESMSGKIPDNSIVLIRKADLPENGIIQVQSYKRKPTMKQMPEYDWDSWTMQIEDDLEKYTDPSDEDYQVQGDFVAVLPKEGK